MLQLMLTLRANGLRTVAVVCDGAGENRAYTRRVLKVKGTPAEWTPYYVPPGFGEDEIVVHLPDFCHIVKKLRNALLSSGFEEDCKRLLTMKAPEGSKHDDVYLSLRLNEAIWKETHGSTGLIANRSLSLDHFHKNGLTAMNVRKAAQIFSNTNARMIESRMSEGPIQYQNRQLESVDLKPMVSMYRTVNNFLDSMNSRVGDTGHYNRKIRLQDLTAADSPLRAIEECREFFDGWWKDIDSRAALDAAEKHRLFIPHDKCYFDLKQLCMGVMALCNHYLRLGLYAQGALLLKSFCQDVVEHHFCNTRARAGDGDPSYREALRASCNAAMFRVMTDPKRRKSNSGTAPVAESQPLYRKDVRKERRQQKAASAAAQHGTTAFSRAANRVRLPYSELISVDA